MKALTAILLLLLSGVCYSQKAKDYLENGKLIKEEKQIILSYDLVLKILKIDITDGTSKPNPKTLRDSTIYLLEDEEINVHMRPVNPLNYLTKYEIKVLIDPVDEENNKAMESILQLLKTVDDKGTKNVTETDKFTNKETIIKVPCKPEAEAIADSIDKIAKYLEDNKKKEIVDLFEKLKLITFVTPETTLAELTDIDNEKKLLHDHFKNVETRIEAVIVKIKNYSCDDPPPFVAKYIFNKTLKEVIDLKNEQKKRLLNLDKMYKLVNDARTKALPGVNGIPWCISIPGASVEKGKKTLYVASISEGGFKLSDEKEIINTEVKEITSRTIIFKRFNRFIIEKSAGSAYTFFNYREYGTAKNAAGEEIVADAGLKEVNRINFTAMLNFNYYIRNSAWHPFWQVGIGANTSIPSLLTGIGSRFNVGNARLAIAGGAGFTFIKVLDKLKLGDKVTGTAQIEKDLKSQFSWPPKPYVGLQYVF